MRIAIVIVLLVIPAIATAQYGGHIGLYSDQYGTDCTLAETLFAPNYVYVVHNTAIDALHSQFQVLDNWGALRAGENYGPNLFLGSTPNQTIYEGGAIIYVGCKPLPYLLVTLTMIPVTPALPCTYALEVVPDPAVSSGQIEVTTCDEATVFGTGGFLIVNANSVDCVCYVATEETNWSRVKALYR